MIKRIAHGAIRVKDIKKTVKFYRDIMGFKESFEVYDNDGAISLVYLYIAEGQFIEIFPNGEGEYSYDPKAVAFAHMCYEVDDIELALKEMRLRGAIIDGAVKAGRTGALQFWIYDPDGNRIEIVQLPPESMQAKANEKFRV